MLIHGVWLLLFFSTLNCQFVLDNYPPTCVIWGLTFLRKTWDLSHGDFNVIFNVCDPIHTRKCPNKKMCIKSKSDKLFLIHGNEFKNGTNGKLIVDTGNKCTVSIQLICTDALMEKPRLQRIGECEFELLMMRIDCTPKCMINYRGYLINLRPLQNTYHVESKKRRFSVAFCGSNKDCNGLGASSCDITDVNAIVPLSSNNNEKLIYRDDLNEIQFHGGFNTDKKNQKKVFEVLLKCNWTLSIPHLKYVEPQTQGKRYLFQMESKYGCVKIPPICEFLDKFHMYNVTDLHNRNGYWEVVQVPGHKKMVLNVCGLLKPAFMAEDNDCSKSSAQVCDIFEGKYTNRGSFHHDLDIVNEKLSISLTNGDPCISSPNQQLRTFIELECSDYQENPMFIKEENCVTYLQWKTPSACPKVVEEKCDNRHPDTHYNCTLETSEKIYNLSDIHKKNPKYIVNDSDKNLQYLLTVCGSLHDEEVPCMKDSMVVLKNLTEANVIHKFKSYGGFRNISENAKGQLVIETDGGANCGHNGNITYCRSTVFLECSKEEKYPMLLSRTDVTLEFLWETPAACSIPKEVVKPCIFENPFNNYLINFTKLQKTELKVGFDNNSTYFFDLCENDQSKCKAVGCTYISLNKTIITYGNETHLEVNLDKPCNSKNQFNKTVFELICDKIAYNDHFELKNIENCILMFQLKTHLACEEANPVIEIDKNLSNKAEYNVQKSDKEKASDSHERIDENHRVIDVPHDQFITELKCLVTNPHTGYQFNLSSLNLNLTSPNCPRRIFNKRYVSLVFDSEKTCRQSSVASDKIPYTVILHCPSGNHADPIKTEEFPENSECNVVLQRPEACRLLEETILTPKKLGSGSVAGIVIAVLTIFGLTAFILWKWKIRYVIRSAYDAMPYNKDADL